MLMSKQILFLMVLISLTSIDTSNDDKGQVWGSLVEGCRIRLSAGHDHYKFGEAIDLQMTIQNVNRKEFGFGNGRFPYQIEVFLPNGENSVLTFWGKETLKSLGSFLYKNVLVRLGPGETDVIGFPTVNRAFDMTLDGKYLIIVTRRISSELDPNASIELVSNPVTVEIDEK